MILFFKKKILFKWYIIFFGYLFLTSLAFLFYSVDGEHVHSDFETVCPSRALFGVVCPFCGATRSFVLFVHGSKEWLQYNYFWPVLLTVLFVLAFLFIFLFLFSSNEIKEKLVILNDWIFSKELNFVLLFVLFGWAASISNYNNILS